MCTTHIISPHTCRSVRREITNNRATTRREHLHEELIKRNVTLLVAIKIRRNIYVHEISKILILKIEPKIQSMMITSKLL